MIEIILYYFNRNILRAIQEYCFFFKNGTRKREEKKIRNKNLELKFFILYELKMITIFVKNVML